jgi:3-deoxy-D-manno-octulosonic acid kinase
MKILEIGNQRICYDDRFLDPKNTPCFDPGYWNEHNRIIGTAVGRGMTYFIALDKIDVALRHYKRGGLFSRLIEDSYIFTSWEKTRSFQEYQVLLHLIERGVNVPRPIGARAVRSGPIYTADLISEKVPNANDLVSILSDTPLQSHHYANIGIEIAKMHCAGVNHTDLNIHNILLDRHNTVWIIDFDKCNAKASTQDKTGNLNRLYRSFVKEKTKNLIHWQNSDWDTLMSSYTNFILNR